MLLTTVTGTIIHLDDHFMETLNNQLGYRYIRDAHNGISISNEIKSMQYLESLCYDYLHRYRHTYESDCERLNDGSLPLYSNERNAVIQLKGEKEILIFYHDYSIIAQKLLHMYNVKEFEEYMAHIRDTKHNTLYQMLRIHIVRLKIDEQKHMETKQNYIDYNKPVIV